ncbi:MAG: hypothetical protein IPO77_01745 [Acidobacteria bacterium]|nr:hypothetical protein [Acidobacteriota bacterium]
MQKRFQRSLNRITIEQYQPAWFDDFERGAPFFGPGWRRPDYQGAGGFEFVPVQPSIPAPPSLQTIAS